MKQSIKTIMSYILTSRKRMLLASLTFGIAVMFICAGATLVSAANEDEMLRENFVRFHVRANSNSPEDQNLKREIKDAVLAALENGLMQCKTKEETLQYLSNNTYLIEETAQRIISGAGTDYAITANIERAVFPAKQYTNVTLPPGEYDALVIRIGSGTGDNWWCVMFPQICFVDAALPELPQEQAEQLAALLDDEALERVTSDDPVEWRFWVLDWLNSVFK